MHLSLRTRFLLYVGLVHGVLAVLAAQFRATNPPLFVASEALLLVGLAGAAHLYYQFVRPLQLIAAGTAAMQAKDFSLTFLPVGQPDLDQLIDVYNHMLDALRQERVGQHEKSVLLERLLHASPAGIFILDFDGNLESLNPAAERLLNAGPAAAWRGQPLAALPGAWGTALAALAPQQAATVRLNGMETYRAQAATFLDRGFARRFIMVAELTRELIKQEKHAYEQLIRMMSHEVNNSIGAINSILGSFYHYRGQLAPADQPDFEQALEVSIQRNTQLANFIGGFAQLVRLPPPARHPTDVHALLLGLGRLLAPHSAAQGIVWHWHLAATPLLVSLDAGQLEQALLNVAKNALEAVPAGGGNIWVSTTAHPPALCLANDGPGIAPAVAERLFTPFFSTKPDGQGIGLLLVRDILLAHGFRFSLATEASGRTAFRVALD